MTDLWKQRKVNKKSFKNLKRKRFAKVQPYIKIVQTHYVWASDWNSGYWSEFHHRLVSDETYFRCYRKVRTLQERRLSELTEDELSYGVRIRGRRKNVPTCWDEIAVSFPCNTKNWKLLTKRRKQWVPKQS